MKNFPEVGKTLPYKAGGWTREELSRYPRALNERMNFAMGSKKGTYESTVMGVIDQFNLTRFD